MNLWKRVTEWLDSISPFLTPEDLGFGKARHAAHDWEELGPDEAEVQQSVCLCRKCRRRSGRLTAEDLRESPWAEDVCDPELIEKWRPAIDFPVRWRYRYHPASTLWYECCRDPRNFFPERTFHDLTEINQHIPQTRGYIHETL